MTQFQKATLGCLGASVVLMLALVLFVYFATADTVVEVQIVRQVESRLAAITRPDASTRVATAVTRTPVPTLTATRRATATSTATMTVVPQPTATSTRVVPAYTSPTAAPPTPRVTPALRPTAEVFSGKIQKGPTPDALSFPMVEADSLVLINEVRQKAGLAGLVRDPVLDEIARSRSEDMLKRSYFSHHDPATGGLALEKLFNEGQIQFLQAGENLAYFLGPGRADDLPSIAVEKWMASENHRKNILEGMYNLTGFGVAGARTQEGNVWYLTQVFVQR